MEIWNKCYEEIKTEGGGWQETLSSQNCDHVASLNRDGNSLAEEYGWSLFPRGYGDPSAEVIQELSCRCPPDPHCLHCHGHHVVIGREDCVLYTFWLIGCICCRSCNRTAVLNVWRRQCIWAGEVPQHGPTSALWQHCDAIGSKARLKHQSCWFPYRLHAGRVKWPHNNIANSCVSTLSTGTLHARQAVMTIGLHCSPTWTCVRLHQRRPEAEGHRDGGCHVV